MDLYNYKNNFDMYKNVNTTCVLSNKVNNPFFTIMMPTYKRAETISTALESVLSQIGFDNYEVVIVNNMPAIGEDETRKVVEGFASDKVSYYINDENIGLCGNWNRCIEKARGEYIIMLHDDDMMGPYCLNALNSVINILNKPAMVGCSNINFTSDNLPSFNLPNYYELRKVTKESLFHGRYLGIAGMTFRKDLAMKIGGFNEEFYPNEDTFFIYQMLMEGMVVNIENPLVGYRTEINLTTSEGVLERIVLLTEYMRRNIAEHEKFAEKWMKKYDKAYLYGYIKGANYSWNSSLDYEKIFEEFSMGKDVPSKVERVRLRIAEKIEKLMHSRNEKMKPIKVSCTVG